MTIQQGPSGSNPAGYYPSGPSGGGAKGGPLIKSSNPGVVQTIGNNNKFIEWIERNLYDKIEYLWKGQDAAHARLDKARRTICEFFRPDMDTDIDSNHDGNLLGHSIYEGTPPWAAQTMAIGFQSHQYSKAVDWINYKMNLQMLREVDALDMWCMDIRDHMTQTYQRGNFYEVQPKFTLNAITIGSPVMFSEENLQTGEIFWIPQHYKTYRLFYDKYNRVEGIIVKEPWTIKQIYERFCQGYTKEERIANIGRLSTFVLKNLEAQNFSVTAPVVRACFKRDNPLWYGVRGLPLGGKLWYDAYFEESTGNKETPLEISGFWVKPFVNWDYDKNPWETASRTPAFESIYDTVTLQQVFKNYIENVQINNKKPIVAPEGLQGQLNLGAGGESYIDSSNWEIKPYVLDNIGDVRLELETADRLEANLKRHFKTDLFSIMSDIAMHNKQPLTALQILEIKGEKINMTSPMLDNNEYYLKQCDDRAKSIEMRAGRGPFAPEIMEKVADIVKWYTHKKGINFDDSIVPEFIGRLRQAQQQQQKLEPLSSGLAFAREVRDIIDPDLPALAIRGWDVLSDGFLATNFPMKNMRPREEYEQLAANLQESRSQQLQQENTIETIKALKGAKPEMLQGVA